MSDAVYSIHAVLEHYGWDLPGERTGWVSVRCCEHDDSHASARINEDEGAVACLACGFKGDVYSVIMQKEGCSYREAVNRAKAITADSGRDIREQPAGRRGVSASPRLNTPGRAYVPAWRRGRATAR